jgi:iron complex transport system ATP-binding protein
MKNSLTAQNLTVHISNQIICQQLNLTLKRGDICGILGPNGSGKTTLLHTLANLHPVHAGEIFLDNQLLTELKPNAIAQKLGILFQDTSALFSQSVLEFCLTGRHPHLSRLAFESANDKAIALAALTRMDLDKKLSQAVHTLSGGERRRLAIATLLTQTPQIYLLDEPMNHLDIRHQMLILHHFKKLATNQSAAVMMSLHDMNIAEHFCTHVLLLFGDGTSLYGTPKDILTTQNLSHLYQYPVQSGSIGPRQFWLPQLTI